MIQKSGIAGSQSNPMLLFSFSPYCQIILQNDCISLYSYQQWMGVSVAPHPCQHLGLPVFHFSHASGCGLVLHYIFNLHFPDDKQNWATFHMFIGHLNFLFYEVLLQIFCPVPSIRLSVFSLLIYSRSFIYSGYTYIYYIYKKYIICKIYNT